jgi:hypothetical protein
MFLPYGHSSVVVACLFGEDGWILLSFKCEKIRFISDITLV